MDPTTDSASGATLNGAGWLSNLLRDGIAGYVAVQTVKTQNRTPGSVTTQTTVPVEAPAGTGAGISQKTLLIAGGILAAALALLLILRRK